MTTVRKKNDKCHAELLITISRLNDADQQLPHDNGVISWCSGNKQVFKSYPMKTILAATDFSLASRNAVNYAAGMAAKGKLKLILFHACHPPVMVPEAYAIMPTLDELIKDGLRRLKRTASALRLKHGAKLPIECVCKCGFAADEIGIYATANHVDLVIMGMHGAGKMSERLFGSTTTLFLKNAPCPTLSIYKNVKFRNIKKIVYASDYKAQLPVIGGVLKDLVKMYGAQVHILHVFPERRDIPSLKQAVTGIQLDRSFKDIKHSFHEVNNKDVVQGINDYVAANKIDLVIMTPRKHPLFESLFKESNTKRMAFHTSVPLLTLH